MAFTATIRLPFSFTRLAWANLAAQAAEQLSLAAAPIVAVLALGAGAGQTGLLQTAQTLPFLLFAIPAGLLADRVSRRGLMTVAELLRALSLLALLALVTTGGLTLPLLAVLGFAGACGTVAFMVAAPALVPRLVPARDLVRANGRIELARTIAFTAGPALAGVIIARTGAPPAFALAATLSLCAVLLLAGLREPARTAAPARHLGRDLAQGARFVLHHQILLPILIVQTVFNTSWFVMQAVFVPYAVHQLGLSAAGVGATLAVYGVGLIAGALLAPALVRRVPFGAVILIGPLCGLAAGLLMLATIGLPWPLLAGASYFLLGAGPVVWIVSTTTLRQVITPPDMLGRVTAIFLLATGTRSVGAGIGALVGGLYGVDACLVVAAIGFLAQAMITTLAVAQRRASAASARLM